MPENLNSQMQDKLIARQHDIEDVAQALVAKYLKMFKVADRNIANILSDYMGKTKWSAKEQKAIINKLKQSESDIAAKYKEAYTRDYKGLGEAEATYLLNTLEKLGIPNELLKILSANNYWSRRDDKPLVMDQKQYDIIPYMDAQYDVRWSIIEPIINTAFVTGVSMSAVLSTLYGDKEVKGALSAASNSLKARILTATDHIVNAARYNFYSDNDHLIMGYYWEAILDEKTCEICAGLSGKIRAIDKNSGLKTTLPAWAYPPVHRHCRCILIPIFRNSKNIGKYIKQLPDKTIAIMDGKLPEGLTYPEWFRKQTEEIQRKAIGAERFKLYKSGEVKITEFARKSTILSLAALGVVMANTGEEEKNQDDSN